MGTTRSKTYLSRAEVARLFRVSPFTVAGWAAQGNLPFSLTLGGECRYPPEGTLAIFGDIARRAQEAKNRAQPRRTRQS